MYKTKRPLKWIQITRLIILNRLDWCLRIIPFFFQHTFTKYNTSIYSIQINLEKDNTENMQDNFIQYYLVIYLLFCGTHTRSQFLINNSYNNNLHSHSYTYINNSWPIIHQQYTHGNTCHLINRRILCGLDFKYTFQCTPAVLVCLPESAVKSRVILEHTLAFQQYFY